MTRRVVSLARRRAGPVALDSVVAIAFIAVSVAMVRDWEIPKPGGVPFVPVYLAAIAAGLVAVRVVTGAAPPVAVLVVAVVAGMVLTDLTLVPTQAFRDLGIYFKAGQHFVAGRAVYQTGLTTSVPVDRTDYPYLYPPFTLPFVGLVSAVPLPIVEAVVTVVGVAALFVAFRLIGIRPRWWVPLLLWPPVFQGLYVGNVVVFTTLLFAAGPWFGAGLVLAAAFKAYSGLAALWLVRERRWHQLALGIAALVVVSIVTLPLVGIDQWRAWIAALDAFRRSQAVLPEYLYGGALPRYLPWVVSSALAVLAVAAAAFARRTEGLARFGVATVVASPSLYGHGFILALPAITTLRLRWAWLALGLTTISPGGANTWAAIVLVALSWVLLVLRRPSVSLPSEGMTDQGRGGEIASYDLLGGAARPWPAAPSDEPGWIGRGWRARRVDEPNPSA
ncbi:MAG TPA: glycosyltransferase family 87 protein [Candidatus Limnocylindrales bacterium]